MGDTRADVRGDVRADARADEGYTLHGMWFDGTDDLVDLGDGDPLGLNGAAKIEVEAQIYIDGAPSGTEDIFSTFVDLSRQGMGVDIQATGKIRVSGRSVTTDAFENFITTEVLAAGSHTIKAYADFTNDEFGVSINGQAYETSAATFANAVYTYSGSTEETRIGSNEPIGRFFAGRLGQVKVWKDDVLCDHYIGDGNADANWLDNGTGNIGMWFDGTDDYVDLGVAPIQGSVDFSIEADIYLTVVSGSRMIVGGRDANDDGVRLAVVDGDLLASINEADYTAVGAISVNTPYRIIFAVDYDGTKTLTVNGAVVDSSTTNPAGAISTTESWKVGRVAYSAAWHPTGFIGNVIVRDASGDAISSWIGDGNADANWEDQVGSNDGTVAGSPTRALSTSTGWREANDGTVAGSPNAAISTDGGATWTEVT